MHDRVGGPELAVVLAEAVEAVRAGHEDLPELVLLEGLDVLLGELGEQVLVPHPPRRVARALLLEPEGREVHLRGLQDPDEGLVRLARPRVGGAGAPDPQQVLDLAPAEVRHHGDVEALRPLQAPVLADAPRVALHLHALEGARGLLREVGLHHHEALPEADEVAGNGVDEDGAGLHAGRAGRAGPELVHVNLPPRGSPVARTGSAVDLRLRDEGRLRLEGRFLLRLPREGATLRVAEPQDVRPVAVAEVDLQVVEHLHRLEGLPGGVGRARRVAAPALGAGVGVEEALPGQLLHAVDPELLGLLEVDPRRKAVALAPVEPGVRPGEHEVHVLGRGQVRGEAQEHEHVGPPAEGAQALRPRRREEGEGARGERAEGLPRHGGRVPRRPLLQEHGRADEDEEGRVEHDDEPEDPLAVLRARQQPGRVAREPPHEGDDTGHEDGGGEHVLAEVVERVEPGRQHPLVEEGPAPEGLEEGGQALEEDLEVPQAEDQEAVEEDPVQEAGRGVLLDPLLAQGVGEHRAGPPSRVVGQRLVATRARVDQDARAPEALRHEAERRDEKAEGQEGLENGQHHGVTTSRAPSLSSLEASPWPATGRSRFLPGVTSVTRAPGVLR